jgi:hypothetical protein
VTYLHGMLEYKQYGSGFACDTFDATTEAAVRYAQQRNSLRETGQCDEATWAAMTSEQSASAEHDAPGDFGISMADEVAAPDVEVLLGELECRGSGDG